MESLSSVPTVSGDAFILVFLHIQRIILKSTRKLDILQPLINSSRILIATIRNLGNCPCPRCLIQKKYISGLGTTADDQRRQHLRTDDAIRVGRVDSARRILFKYQGAPTSQRIEGILKPRSEVPIRVSRVPLSLPDLPCKKMPCRMPFQKSCYAMD